MLPTTKREHTNFFSLLHLRIWISNYVWKDQKALLFEKFMEKFWLRDNFFKSQGGIGSIGIDREVKTHIHIPNASYLNDWTSPCSIAANWECHIIINYSVTEEICILNNFDGENIDKLAWRQREWKVFHHQPLFLLAAGNICQLNWPTFNLLFFALEHSPRLNLRLALFCVFSSATAAIHCSDNWKRRRSKLLLYVMPFLRLSGDSSSSSIPFFTSHRGATKFILIWSAGEVRCSLRKQKKEEDDMKQKKRPRPSRRLEKRKIFANTHTRDIQVEFAQKRRKKLAKAFFSNVFIAF